MIERQYLEAKVFSRREFDDATARRQLEWLANFDGGNYRPSKCGVSEPLRGDFDPAALVEPVRWLSQPGGEFKFSRAKPVRMEGYLANQRFAPVRIRTGKGDWKPFVPKVAEPVFVSVWTVWIEISAVQKFGIDSLRNFLTGAFDVAGADFAFLTTESDYKRKHFSVTRDSKGTVEEFVGDDPERGLPGLYWMNIFGKAYADWFGAANWGQVKATVREPRPDGSLFLQFGEQAVDADSNAVASMQAIAKDRLGTNAFFDIAAPKRMLVTPEWQPSAESVVKV